MSEERYTDVNIDFDLRNMEAQSVGKIQAISNDFQFCKSHNKTSLYTNGASNRKYPDFMSKELNYNILDGSLPIANFDQTGTANQSVLFVGENNPSFKLYFEEAQSSVGLILYFLGNYPKLIKITWLQYVMKDSEETNLLLEQEFNVTSNQFVVMQPVFDYNEILVEIEDVWVPNSITKMYYVQMGVDSGWQDNQIKTATLVQEMNLLADKMSLNTFNFEIIDQDNYFNYGNNSNTLDFFERLSPIYPKVLLDDEEIELGKYYLDTVESNLNLVKFKCFSAIGILDTIPFNEGTMYNGTAVSTILTTLFRVAGITSYLINPDIGQTLVYGTIEPCTCRQALQKLLFVSGGVARTDDVNYQIIIDTPSIALGKTIQRSEKISTNVTDAEYVTGVELDYSTYTASDDTRVIVEKATYTPGEHTVIFSQPCVSANIVLKDSSQPVTVLAQSTYYIKFKTAELYSATLEITGKVYESKTSKVVATRSPLKAGAIENVKTFSTTLCDYIRAFDLVNDLLKYYIQSTLDIKIKQFSKDNSMIGRQVIQNEISGLGNYVGRYSSRTFNLTGGFVDDAKLVGYYEFASDSPYYMDNANTNKTDLYSGDDILI